MHECQPHAAITVDEVCLDIDLVSVIEHAVVFVLVTLGHAD